MDDLEDRTRIVVRPSPSGRRPGRGTGTGLGVASGSSYGTVVTTVRAENPLRLIQPVFHGTTSAAVCVVTFGGGLVDGDRIELDVTVERGATLVAFTQSSTKVFRGASSQIVRAKVDGTLVWLPDPVAAFADAHYEQRIDVELGSGGACVLLDGFTAGRAAFGDRWAMRRLDLRTRIAAAGRTVVNDALWLDAADGSIAERAGPHDAFSTLVAVGEGARPVIDAIAKEPVVPPTEELAVASSPLPCARDRGVPGAILRVAAARPMDALAEIRTRLRNLREMNAVDPFASRY